MEAAHKDDASKRVKIVHGTFMEAFVFSSERRCTDRDVDGGSNTSQMEAIYAVVTTEKKIDGGETWGRDLRDEEEGFPQTAHLSCGKRLRHNGLCPVRASLESAGATTWNGQTLNAGNDAHDATWHISEVHAA